MNKTKEVLTYAKMRELSQTFGYGEIKISKMFNLTLRESRKIVKGINEKDKRYEKKHRELNTNQLPNATHFMDITFPFHSMSIQKGGHSRKVLISTDGFILMEVGLRIKNNMQTKRKRFKIIANEKEEKSLNWNTILNILVSFNEDLTNAKIVFDRYYKNLKNLEKEGITPIVVAKSHVFKRLIKEFDKEYIKNVKRCYNSEAESIFGNVAKRIYAIMNYITYWHKIPNKKRYERRLILNYEEMEKLHIALCDAEDNNNPLKVIEIMEYLKTIKKEEREKQLTQQIIV